MDDTGAAGRPPAGLRKPEKLKIAETVVVEGKYDKIRLTSVIDANILETGGFAIYRDPEQLELLRRLAEKTGLLILTDSDRAGFQIRNYLKSAITTGRVLHAFIPDILGKEKRKAAPSREGKLGVEGMDRERLLAAFRKAGVTGADSTDNGPPVTKADLYFAGISGGQGSAEQRRELLRLLGLPQRLSANALLPVINATMTREDFLKALEGLQNPS